MMQIARLCLAGLALFLLSSPVGAARSTLAEGGSPVKWKWYYTQFGGPSYSPPTVFWGSATIVRKGTTLQVEMQAEPKTFHDKANLLPGFRGVIHPDNQVDGVVSGLLTETDPRPVHGNYHSIPGRCLTETIVLSENMGRENVLVFHRGTPAGCGLVW